MQKVEAAEFLKEGKQNCIIDVRSPEEYLKGHIPGAVNIPIFDNLERAKVGTVYKQQSKEDAVTLGLEIVGPKMKSFVQSAKALAANGMLCVYCWRGGMRSEKMAWLFELVGLKTQVMIGGYKAYRNFLHQQFEILSHLIVVQAPTGSGKTKILHALKAAGQQVIDLEGLANHKGSAFGGLGEEDQPSTQQFQNDILADLLAFDLAKPVWIESESVTIGRVYLPEKLWQKMNAATVLVLTIPREQRVQHIVDQYGAFSIEALSQKIGQLQQNIGGANVKDVIALVEQGKLHDAVDILLRYYDESYAHSVSKYKSSSPISVSLTTTDANINAQILINKVLEIHHD